MTSSDDRWIEMEYLEPDVAELVRTAQGPATPDELAAEREIVGLMQETILLLREAGAAIDEAAVDEAGVNDGEVTPLPARRRRSTTLRRLVAAKTAAFVALVALGMAAAEATTGVVSAVFPGRNPEIERQIPVPTDPPRVPGPPGSVPPPVSVPNTDMPPPGRPRAANDDAEATGMGTQPADGSGTAATASTGSGNGQAPDSTPNPTTPSSGAGGATSGADPTSADESPTTTDSPDQRGTPPGLDDDRPPPGHGRGRDKNP